MSTSTEIATTQVYRVWIKASPEQIWEAITSPEWAGRYGYGGNVSYELEPGGKFVVGASEQFLAAGAPDVIVDGEVIEADPPRKLVQTWRMLMDEQLASEGFTRLTYEIAEGEGGVTKLTLTHELEGAPQLAKRLSGGLEDAGAGGGWAFVLSSLKSLLETGETMLH